MPKVAIVLGAGEGLGKSLVRVFTKENYSVGILSRKQKTLDSVQQSVSKEIPSALLYTATCDATSQDSIQEAVDQILKKANSQTIDTFIVNCAYLDLDKEGYRGLKWDNIMKGMEVKVGGTINSAKVVLPLMEKQKRGNFFVTGGGAGLSGIPIMTNVGIQNGSARILVKCISKEVQECNIQVTCFEVCGMIKKENDGSVFSPDEIAKRYFNASKRTKVSEFKDEEFIMEKGSEKDYQLKF